MLITHLQPTPTAPHIPVRNLFEVPPMSGKNAENIYTLVTPLNKGAPPEFLLVGAGSNCCHFLCFDLYEELFLI